MVLFSALPPCCNEEIDPELLQKALDLTLMRLPFFAVRLRRGLFWYYLETSESRPPVETGCAESAAALDAPEASQVPCSGSAMAAAGSRSSFSMR